MDTQRHRYFSLLQLQVSMGFKLVFSFCMMLLLILLVYCFAIPNPNMILIAGLVICSAVFGYGGGIVAGIVMLLYTLFFFSTNNNFIHFTDENAKKVAVSLIGIVVDMVFVCELKRREVAAFDEIHSLTIKLDEENRMLQAISLTDGLTHARNRLALRQDFPRYVGREVTVVMLDIDHFKSINDRFGHDEGDRILASTAAVLMERFGPEHCYRYGGDEFLMICPDLSEADFRERISALNCFDGDGRFSYSIGCIRRFVDSEEALRKLFSDADERMYAAKQGGRNQIVGDCL